MASIPKSAMRLGRRKILDIIRGHAALFESESASAISSPKPTAATTTRIFPLQRQHFASLEPHYREHHENPLNPEEFHSILCQRIEKASKRVYLASLYVGPAVDPNVYRLEAQLLQSITKAAAKQNGNLDIKILLDQSRGLRPVPLAHKKETTTSAEACRQALIASSHTDIANGQIYLHSVLPTYLKKILPNPLNEVAGVFHIKVYIMDDELILSGANLSEEYFTDRHDRYLHIVRGGNGLVDWYAELVNLLCQHSEKYQGPYQALQPASQPRQTLTAAIRKLLQGAGGNDLPALDDVTISSHDVNTVVAMACPTFQAPLHYGADYRSDTAIVMDLLRQMGRNGSRQTLRTTSPHGSDDDVASTDTTRTVPVLRLASAYLNPTLAFQRAWKSIEQVHCLTAGYLSHGFRPKQKAGNKGRTWIPAIFDVLARALPFPKIGADGGGGGYGNVHVWYYTRADWTFHAKGLWLSMSPSNPSLKSPPLAKGSIQDEEDLVCVTHGSGNYGERSEVRDMESNLFLVLPIGSPLVQQYKEEWNQMCEHAVPVEKSGELHLQWYLRASLPWIKNYF